MTHAIAVLRQEHKSMGKLFRLMESLLQELDDGQSPDFRLLHDIGDYLRGYPDQCHHPKEDLIYRKLMRRDPAVLESGSDLLLDHERLAKLIDRYVSLLVEAQDEPQGSNETFLVAMSDLVDNYKRHMEMEETYFFPTAIDRLTGDDWAEINFAVSEQVDPLFDEASTKFQKLRNEIFRLADEHEQSANLRVQSAETSLELAALETVDQFNSLMTDHGLRVQLRKSDDGGYSVNDEQRTVFAIPECSEKQAAWCAFCFAKGQYH